MIAGNLTKSKPIGIIIIWIKDIRWCGGVIILLRKKIVKIILQLFRFYRWKWDRFSGRKKRHFKLKPFCKLIPFSVIVFFIKYSRKSSPLKMNHLACNIILTMINILNLINHFQYQHYTNDQWNQSTEYWLNVRFRRYGNGGQYNDRNMNNRNFFDSQHKTNN